VSRELRIRVLAKSCLTKRRYPSAAMAERVAAKCAESRGVKLRVYPCAVCQGYHLTRRGCG
jgi:hypothetical protein